jgi:hypothetical protein
MHGRRSVWQSAAWSTLLVWLALAALCIVHVGATAVLRGPDGLKALVMAGPASNFYLTFAAVALVWTVVALVLAIMATQRMTPRLAARVVCYSSLALLFINVLRERTYYLDFPDYFRAAVNLHTGVPLDGRYLYPPLWAGLLAPLTPLGEEKVFALCWILNVVSAVVMIHLLRALLERYGFSEALALAAVFAFAVVNVPMLRTLMYGQINIHVINLVFLSLLLYPRYPLPSAIALALAAHLKISPLVLAFAFLWAGEIRWSIYFALAVIVIAVIPAVAYGWSPYLDVLHNIRNIAQANGLAFRDNSIDSFMRGLNAVAGLNLQFAVAPLKALLLVTCLGMGIVHASRMTFSDEPRTARVLNQMPTLLILIVMVSPLVWEHHPVLLGLSYLVTAKLMRTPGDWCLFGMAYCLEFLMPTFDFFPWSYGRLLSPFIVLGLTWVRRGQPASEPFRRANRWLAEKLSAGPGNPGVIAKPLAS